MNKKLFFLIFLILISFKNQAQTEAMVKVDGGTFKMNYKDENKKAVWIDVTVSGFEISKHEVTVKEWKTYLKETSQDEPKRPVWGWTDEHPITNITWVDAVQYCNWLSKSNGLTPVYTQNGNKWECNFKANGYRLPTEAEWTFAAKGGTKSKKTTYAGGNDLSTISWYAKNSKKSPQKTATKLPNELDIYDMSGNVWEWVWDYNNSLYYKMAVKDNPTGSEKGENRCLKGGSWDSSKLEYLRPEYQLSWNPNKTNDFFGFRVARSLTKN